MADVTINYEGNAIATMSASGTKTLQTQGKYCTDDIEVVYVSPGGGGNTFPYTHIHNLFAVDNGPGQKPVGAGPNVVMDLPYCESIQQTFFFYIGTPAYYTGILNAELTLYHPVNVRYFTHRNNEIQTITFPNGVSIKGDVADFIHGTSITSVTGDIDASGATATTVTSAFQGATNLQTISFKQNTIPGSITFTSASLTNASMVSIANGLDESVTGKTLSHNGTVIAAMGSIMGNVAMDGTNTYHIFTEDAGGNTTLLDFVTLTKGWTVA